ncbi:MAG TPA: DUF6496 domain-containing protein [Kofleriaceae bacterium]|jgi:hypothetical protein|nr:DUF6496 domain-containing protein [Kofleriaceae bacterium]
MPEKATVERARRKLRSGRSPRTAAGEFVREEIHHVRKGKHGARSSKQAIAIGLSKARRAGVGVPAPRKGTTSARTRRAARRELEAGKTYPKRKPSRRRAKATTRALRREGRAAGTRRSLSTQGRRASARRTHEQRSRAARKGAATKGSRVRSQAARKAARTRQRRARSS